MKIFINIFIMKIFKNFHQGQGQGLLKNLTDNSYSITEVGEPDLLTHLVVAEHQEILKESTRPRTSA